MCFNTASSKMTDNKKTLFVRFADLRHHIDQLEHDAVANEARGESEMIEIVKAITECFEIEITGLQRELQATTDRAKSFSAELSRMLNQARNPLARRAKNRGAYSCLAQRVKVDKALRRLLTDIKCGTATGAEMTVFHGLIYQAMVVDAHNEASKIAHDLLAEKFDCPNQSEEESQSVQDTFIQTPSPQRTQAGSCSSVQSIETTLKILKRKPSMAGKLLTEQETHLDNDLAPTTPGTKYRRREASSPRSKNADSKALQPSPKHTNCKSSQIELAPPDPWPTPAFPEDVTAYSWQNPIASSHSGSSEDETTTGRAPQEALKTRHNAQFGPMARHAKRPRTPLRATQSWNPYKSPLSRKSLPNDQSKFHRDSMSPSLSPMGSSSYPRNSNFEGSNLQFPSPLLNLPKSPNFDVTEDHNTPRTEIDLSDIKTVKTPVTTVEVVIHKNKSNTPLASRSRHNIIKRRKGGSKTNDIGRTLSSSTTPPSKAPLLSELDTPVKKKALAKELFADHSCSSHLPVVVPPITFSPRTEALLDHIRRKKSENRKRKRLD